MIYLLKPEGKSSFKSVITFKMFVSRQGLVDGLENGFPELFRNVMHNHFENRFARLFD